MRVSPSNLLLILAASGSVGLHAAPASADSAIASDHAAATSLAQESESEIGTASLTASDLSEPLDVPVAEANTLDFNRVQAALEPASVTENLQGAIDGYRATEDAAATIPLPDLQPSTQDFLAAEGIQLSQTPSTPSEITPEEAQRIIEGAVQRRSQPQASPPEQGQSTEGEETDGQTPDGEVAEPSEAVPETPAAAEEPEEPRVLVAEVQVTASEGELDPGLENLIYSVIETRAGRATTRTQLQQDINNIFATGFFADVDATPVDTDLGVQITFVVQPNPVLTDVRIEGNEVMPQSVVDDIFVDQKGQIINLIDFQEGILEINQWYQNEGYVLAQVVAAPRVSPEGEVILEVAEGVIESIQVRYINDLGQTVNDDGEPIRGRTHPYIITREFETQPGDVFNQAQIEQDFQRVFGLQIFEDVVPGLEPAQNNPREVTVIVNVQERNTGSVAAGLGFNFTGNLFGTVSYRQDNFGGNNQKFVAEGQLSLTDILFDISFTDPWIAGDPFRTSYTANAFANLNENLNFTGGPITVNLPNGDQARIRRLGAGITFARPFDNGWVVAVGTIAQNVSSRDASGNLSPVDADGNPLTFSGTGIDDLWTFPMSATFDRRNNPLNPTSGSILRVNAEQSVPLGRGSVLMSILRGSFSYFIPVGFLNFNEGPQTIALNAQAGTVLGDLPPYNAFALGGTNSIRGYDEGEVGSGRSYAQFTAEYRFPVLSFLGGVLFVDAGTDLGSGNAVPGAPGPTRGKPGSGLGYGVGVRISTPLGPLRIDYGFNVLGQGRIGFGFGERF